MTVRKLSVALDAGVASAVAQAAERDGLSVSAWLNRAAEQSLQVDVGLDAVRDWEADHGPLTDDELAAADALLDRIVRSARTAG